LRASDERFCISVLSKVFREEKRLPAGYGYVQRATGTYTFACFLILLL
jgi:hypothetical protein